MRRTLTSLGILGAAGVLFFAVNMIAQATLRGARLDLTENRLYTLSEGARRIARRLEEPITLTLYYSERSATSVPVYKSYAVRVREVLEEFERASEGNVRLRIVDPEPFTDAEDAAVQFGLIGLPVGRTGERFYLGLVGENATGQREIIALFDPSKEEFLEYDITRAIYLLSAPPRRVVGVIAQLPVQGMRDFPLARGQDIPPWQFFNLVRDFFEVRTIQPDAGEIPPEVSLLLVIHPKNLNDRMLYAIDQFVVRGGRLLVFVDPWCEADLPPGVNPMQALGLPRSSNLKKLFDAWGIELVENRYAADRAAALEINAGTATRPEPVTYLAYLGLGRENLSTHDPVTRDLERIIVGTAGILRARPDAPVRLEPIIQTGTDSAMMDVAEVQFFPDPKRVMASFTPAGERLTIAARLTGPVRSAFTENPAASGAGESGSAHVAEGPEMHVIVVADCDMLSDRMWVQEARLGTILLGYSRFANNGDLVLAALDNLGGNSDLMSIRARGTFQRPFERVMQVRRQAEQRFLAKEQELRNKLSEAERSLNELLRQQPTEAGAGGRLILTPEQQAQIERYRRELVQTRRELRDVQHQLRRDIESLGTMVQFVNIGLMPIVVGIAAVGLSTWRIMRRRTWSRTLPPRA